MSPVPARAARMHQPRHWQATHSARETRRAAVGARDSSALHRLLAAAAQQVYAG
jgi:hypothetical protein